MPTTPFYEGPLTVRRITTANSNSLHTQELDPFRQGVELTLPQFYTMGIAKIHAGETNHQIKQNNVGQLPDAIYPNTTRFIETDVFDPVIYITRDVYLDTLSPVLAFKAYSTTEETLFDGVIEPFSIRDEIQFSSIDSPVLPHSVKANLEGGNFNSRVKSDRVVTVQKFSEKRARFFAYEDNVDTFNGFPVSLGFFPNDLRIVMPFDDTQLTLGRYVTGSMGRDVQAALFNMHPDSDNYVPFGSVREVAGFDD